MSTWHVRSEIRGWVLRACQPASWFPRHLAHWYFNLLISHVGANLCVPHDSCSCVRAQGQPSRAQSGTFCHAVFRISSASGRHPEASLLWPLPLTSCVISCYIALCSKLNSQNWQIHLPNVMRHRSQLQESSRRQIGALFTKWDEVKGNNLVIKEDKYIFLSAGSPRENREIYINTEVHYDCSG